MKYCARLKPQAESYLRRPPRSRYAVIVVIRIGPRGDVYRG